MSARSGEKVARPKDTLTPLGGRVDAVMWPGPGGETGRPLLSREESARRVLSMLGGAITPTVFWLHDGEFEARLTVDPDIAWDALRAAGEA